NRPDVLGGLHAKLQLMRPYPQVSVHPNSSTHLSWDDAMTNAQHAVPVGGNCVRVQEVPAWLFEVDVGVHHRSYRRPTDDVSAPCAREFDACALFLGAVLDGYEHESVQPRDNA